MSKQSNQEFLQSLSSLEEKLDIAATSLTKSSPPLEDPNPQVLPHLDLLSQLILKIAQSRAVYEETRDEATLTKVAEVTTHGLKLYSALLRLYPDLAGAIDVFSSALKDTDIEPEEDFDPECVMEKLARLYYLNERLGEILQWVQSVGDELISGEEIASRIDVLYHLRSSFTKIGDEILRDMPENEMAAALMKVVDTGLQGVEAMRSGLMESLEHGEIQDETEKGAAECRP